eukprot:Skav214260  [mRNA]  locus=scaffold2045:529860:534910:- [translate_table: standard]
MLSKSPDMAKQVVLSERPTISENPFVGSTGGAMQEDDMEDYAETLAQVQEEIQQTAGKKLGLSETAPAPLVQRTMAPEEATYDGAVGRPSASATTSGSAAASSAPPPPLRPLAQVLSEQTRGQQGQTGLRVAAAVVRGNGGAVGMQLMVPRQQP